MKFLKYTLNYLSDLFLLCYVLFFRANDELSWCREMAGEDKITRIIDRLYSIGFIHDDELPVPYILD